MLVIMKKLIRSVFLLKSRLGRARPALKAEVGGRCREPLSTEHRLRIPGSGSSPMSLPPL